MSKESHTLGHTVIHMSTDVDIVAYIGSECDSHCQARIASQNSKAGNRKLKAKVATQATWTNRWTKLGSFAKIFRRVQISNSGGLIETWEACKGWSHFCSVHLDCCYIWTPESGQTQKLPLKKFWTQMKKSASHIIQILRSPYCKC